MSSLTAQEPNFISLTEVGPGDSPAADAFQTICQAAMAAGQATGGHPPQRYKAFDDVIAAANYPKRFVLVADPSVYGPAMWWFNGTGASHGFFSTDADGYRYVASAYT